MIYFKAFLSVSLLVSIFFVRKLPVEKQDSTYNILIVLAILSIVYGYFS